MRIAISALTWVAVLSAMGGQAAAQRTFADVEQRLQSEHLVARWLTLAEIKQNGPFDRRLVPLLLERIEKEPGVLRQLAIQVLAAMGPQAEEAVPALTRRAADGDRDAIRALGRIGPNAAPSVPVLEKHLAGTSPTSRLQAAASLWRINRRPAAMSILEEAARERPKGCSKYFLNQVLAELGEAGEHLIVP